VLDPNSFPLADLFGSLSALASVILVGAVLMILWEVAILLGAFIATLRHRNPHEDTGHLTTR
jgi:hypothetical protein